MFYVAVDPGKVSGVATLINGICRGYEIPARDTGYTVQSLMRGSREDEWEVAIERYTITPGPKTSQGDALKVMGAMEFMCDARGVPFFYYTPGIGKSMCPNTLLKKLGWWQPTRDGHANDAKRVLLAHIAVREPALFGTLTGI